MQIWGILCIFSSFTCCVACINPGSLQLANSGCYFTSVFVERQNSTPFALYIATSKQAWSQATPLPAPSCTVLLLCTLRMLTLDKACITEGGKDILTANVCCSGQHGDSSSSALPCGPVLLAQSLQLCGVQHAQTCGHVMQRVHCLVEHVLCRVVVDARP